MELRHCQRDSHVLCTCQVGLLQCFLKRYTVCLFLPQDTRGSRQKQTWEQPGMMSYQYWCPCHCHIDMTFTADLMSVSVEYVTDIKTIHTTDEDSAFSFFCPAHPPPTFSFCQQGEKKITPSHLLIIINWQTKLHESRQGRQEPVSSSSSATQPPRCKKAANVDTALACCRLW